MPTNKLHNYCQEGSGVTLAGITEILTHSRGAAKEKDNDGAAAERRPMCALFRTPLMISA